LQSFAAADFVHDFMDPVNSAYIVGGGLRAISAQTALTVPSKANIK